MCVSTGLAYWEVLLHTTNCLFVLYSTNSRVIVFCLQIVV